MKTHTSILRRSLLGLCALWFMLGAAHALDLTPRHGLRQGNEGAPTPVLRFSDGQDWISLQPPLGWQASGGGRSLTFFTPDPMSWTRLLVVGRNPAGERASANAEPEDLQAWARRFVPSGAVNVQFVKMIPSPFTVGTQATTEFLFTCTLHGFPVSLSISVSDFSSKERLVMLVAAEPESFSQIRQQAMACMFSWSREG